MNEWGTVLARGWDGSSEKADNSEGATERLTIRTEEVVYTWRIVAVLVIDIDRVVSTGELIVGEGGG